MNDLSFIFGAYKSNAGYRWGLIVAISLLSIFVDTLSVPAHTPVFDNFPSERPFISNHPEGTRVSLTSLLVKLCHAQVSTELYSPGEKEKGFISHAPFEFVELQETKLEHATEGGENEIHPGRVAEKYLHFSTTVCKPLPGYSWIIHFFKDLQLLYCSFLI